jgi:hypothetical protein
MSLFVRLGVQLLRTPIPRGYIVNSLDCSSYRIIGKLTYFLWFQEFIFHNKTVDYSTSTTSTSGSLHSDFVILLFL